MNDRAKDVVTLTMGFMVFPLAWLVWTNIVISPFWGGIARLTSLVWLPGGVLVLTLWFHDHPATRWSIFRFPGRRLEKSPKLIIALVPVMVVSLFLALLAVSGGPALISRSGLYDAQQNTFFTGLVVLIVGLLISSSWLGAKEDYSRTAYVLTGSPRGSLGPRPFPRASPDPQPTEHQRGDRKLASFAAELIGFSGMLTGLLLMISSAFLFS